MITSSCILFRYSLISIVKDIGFETMTTEIRVIKVCVFYVSFFMSGLLVLLISANIKHTIFHGKFADFNNNWFEEIGSII